MEEQETLLTYIEMLNRMPVSRKAREMLDRACAKYDLASLYCVQLARWGYKEGGIEVEDAVMETIEAMLNWRPSRIANFLMINVENMDYIPQGWQDAQMPLDLACIIIDDIEVKMRMHFPWYGSGE